MNQRRLFFLWLQVFILGLTVSFCTSTSEKGGLGTSCVTSADCDTEANLECRAKICRTQIVKLPPIPKISYVPDTPEVGQKVELDGKKSRDPQDDLLTFQWSIQAKPKTSQIKITNPTESIASFIPDKEGDYTFKLEVTAGKKGSSRKRSATVTISVVDRPNTQPIANAGPDQLLEPNNKVALDGSKSFDADSDKLSYAWTFRSKPKESLAKFDDQAAQKPTFKGESIGDYIIQLIVTDERGNVSEPDNVTIRVLEGASKKPVLSKVSPLEGEAYEVKFKVTVEGSDFFKGAKVQLGSQEFDTTYISATKLESVLNLSRVGQGTHAIHVINPNGLSSEPLDFKIKEVPPPVLTSLTPPRGHVGGKLTILVKGKNFIQGRSEILFQAIPLLTKIVSPTELEFSLDLKNTSIGSYSVKVKNPGNLVSNELKFLVQDQLPKPVLRVLNPPSGTVGSKLPFSVHGQGFGLDAVIVFNGKKLKTKRIRSDELQADPELDLGSIKAGKYDVSVLNPDGQSSNKEIFRVRPLDPAPVLSRILPFSLYLDEVMKDVAVYGQDFTKGAKLFINGKEITGALGKVTFRSDSFLLAEINLTDKSIWTKAGKVDAIVENPNGKKSGPFSLTVTYRQPSVNSLIPSSWTNKCDTDVEVRGINFVKAVKVKMGALVFAVGSSTYPLTYVSDKLLKFKLAASKLTAGTLKVFVENGPQASTAAPDFVIGSGASLIPYIRYARPSFGRADTKIQLTVSPDSSQPNGSRSFKPGSVVELNGIKQVTSCSSFSSSYCYQLVVTLDLTGFKAGEYDLHVVNPCNVKSAALSFTVAPPPKPYVSAIKPAFARVGDKVKMSFLGANFAKSHTLTWGGKTVATTFTSDKEIATKDPVDFSAAKIGETTFQITNANGQKTAKLKFSVIGKYTPIINEITGNIQQRGRILSDMTVKGSGFVLTSVAYFDGKRVSSRFISPTEIKIVGIDATSITAGSYLVQVKNGHRASNFYPVELTPVPPPIIDYINPASMVAGSRTSFTLYVYGQQFKGAPNASTLIFKDPSGKDLTLARWKVNYNSGFHMRGNLNVGGLNFGKYTVQVKNPSGELSNKVVFNITPPPPPVLTGVSPVRVSRGTSQTLLLQGANFVNGDLIIFNNNLLNRIPGVATTAATLTGSVNLTNIRYGGKYDVYVLRCLDALCSKTAKTPPVTLYVDNPPCSLVNCAKDLAHVEKCDTASTPQVCRPICTTTADCTKLDSKAPWTCQTGICK